MGKIFYQAVGRLGIELISNLDSYLSIADAVPPQAQRLQHVNNIWSVNHCRTTYME
jgi:hypothetical protein